MKRLALALLALALLAGITVLGKRMLWPERLAQVSIRDLDVDLSLQGVNLSQGRDGRRLWNLNATGARYAEAGDELTLNDPVILYWGEDGDDPVQVVAPNGQIWQKEDRARMWGGVDVTQGNSTMRGQTLDYAGRERSLLLSGGVTLEAERMRGSADRLTYFLDSGDIHAQGRVQVILN